MDSQWLNQATGSNGFYHDKNDARNVVDLTLKLGLGNHGGRSHRIIPSHLFNTQVPITTPDLANFNFNAGFNTSATKGKNLGPTNGSAEHVGLNHFGTSNTGYPNANEINYGGGNIAAEIDFGMMSRGDHSQGGQTLNSLARDTGSQHPSINSNFSNSFNPCLPPTNSLNTYLLLNGSSRNGQIVSSFGSWRRGSRRSRKICYFDPYKRCTNFNCDTRDTPMWRKGPLGPKSLCNACGIKYMREEDRRRAGEATNERNTI